MEYHKVVSNLILNKKLDERFSFPAYVIPVPDQSETGILDARYHEQQWNEKTKTQQDYIWKGIPIGVIRDAMGCENRNIAKSLVEESEFHIPFSDHSVTMYMYRPFHTTKKLPCMVYIHGGAYVGGSYKVCANVCRAICDKEGIVVVNIDYRLAPEYPFPSGIEDCWGCVQWLFENAQNIGVDENEIMIAGDSAGGNYAINCCMKDHALGLSRIRGCTLFYPHVSMVETPAYPWNLDMYQIGTKDKFEIIKNMLGLKEVVRLSELYYLQEHTKKDSFEASPLLCDDVSWMPPTIIFTAEFDYLRIQQEYFAKKLNTAKVPVKVMQYQGMQHAFMDYIGIYPQGEAAIFEACVFHKDKKS